MLQGWARITIIEAIFVKDVEGFEWSKPWNVIFWDSLSHGGDENPNVSAPYLSINPMNFSSARVSETEFMQNEKMTNQNLKQVVEFFIKHAYKDIFRRKFHYILAFCSVFLVVVSTLVINQIISKGSIIFLKIGESSHGEIDAFITPVADVIKETLDKVEYDIPALLNYTAVNDYYENSDPKVLQKVLLAPRKIFSGVKVLSERKSKLYDPKNKLQTE